MHLTRVGNTAASVSCGRCTPNDWNPEGSDSHDEEGLGVVGCQQDAFMSVHLSMCMSVTVCKRERNPTRLAWLLNLMDRGF